MNTKHLSFGLLLALVALRLDAGRAMGAESPILATPRGNESHVGLLRAAKHKVLLGNRDISDVAMRGLEPVADVFTRTLYVGQGAYQTADGRHDHSPAGIKVQAEKMVAAIKKQFEGIDGSRPFIFDLEGGNSINVPVAVDYDPGRDTRYAAQYNMHMRVELRREAVRYQAGLARTVIELFRTREGRTQFEIGWYNLPSISGSRTEANAEGALTNFAADAFETMNTLAAFIGPPAQVFTTRDWATATTAGTLSLDSYIDWLVLRSKLTKQKFPGLKTIPAIWPRWYSLADGKAPQGSPLFPFGDLVLPAGFLRKLCTRLLDEAGVDGFFVWRSSVDDKNDAATTARWNDRLHEVAEVIQKDGRFRRVAYGSR